VDCPDLELTAISCGQPLSLSRFSSGRAFKRLSAEAVLPFELPGDRAATPISRYHEERATRRLLRVRHPGPCVRGVSVVHSRARNNERYLRCLRPLPSPRSYVILGTLMNTFASTPVGSSRQGSTATSAEFESAEVQSAPYLGRALPFTHIDRSFDVNRFAKSLNSMASNVVIIEWEAAFRN